MKQFRYTIPFILFCALITGLYSCCEPQGRSNREQGGIRLYVSNYSGSYYSDYRITRIEFVGKNKIIDYNSYSYWNGPEITLDPKDTVTTIRIYYQDYYEPDTVGDGTITLSYTVTPDYYDDGCEQNMILSYDPKVTSTTFSKAEIKYSYYEDSEPTVHIIP